MNEEQKNKFEAKRAASIQKIVNAALELFAINGYHTTSIENVAKQAGVAKGLIYNYFKSKDELLDAVIFHDTSEFEEIMAHLTKEPEPIKRVRFMIEHIFDMIESRPDYWKFYWSMVLHPKLPDSIRRKINQFISEFIKIAAGLLKDAGISNPGDEAYLLMPTLDAISMMYSFGTKGYPLKRIKKRLVDRYCHELPRVKQKETHTPKRQP